MFFRSWSGWQSHWCFHCVRLFEDNCAIITLLCSTGGYRKSYQYGNWLFIFICLFLLFLFVYLLSHKMINNSWPQEAPYLKFKDLLWSVIGQRLIFADFTTFRNEFCRFSTYWSNNSLGPYEWSSRSKNIRITIKIKFNFFDFQVFFFVLLAAVEVIPFLSGLLQRSAKDALNTKAVMELSEPALYTVNCPKFARKPVKYFAVNSIQKSDESFKSWFLGKRSFCPSYGWPLQTKSVDPLSF